MLNIEKLLKQSIIKVYNKMFQKDPRNCNLAQILLSVKENMDKMK